MIQRNFFESRSFINTKKDVLKALSSRQYIKPTPLKELRPNDRVVIVDYEPSADYGQTYVGRTGEIGSWDDDNTDLILFEDEAVFTKNFLVKRIVG